MFSIAFRKISMPSVRRNSLTERHAGRLQRAVAEAIEPRRLMSAGYALSVAANFGTSIGQSSGLLMDSNGNLFGTTQFGGANDLGVVFEVAAGSNTITTLASFSSSTGGDPLGTLISDSHGNLYGTTLTGGQNNGGTIFELAADSSTITALASFNSTSGVNPQGGLAMDGQGDLYCFTPSGAANNNGAVDELAAGSSTIIPLASFGSSIESAVGAPLLDSSGDIFGNCQFGGTNSDGAVFELVSGGNSVTTLASFNYSTTGEQPVGGLVMDSNGNLYGMTSISGGPNYDGSIFEVDGTSHAISVLASLSQSTGGNGGGTLLIDSQGDLFGTTSFGGANDDGTIIELPAGSSSVDVLASFTQATGGPFGGMLPGMNQDCNLVMDSQGDLFGATDWGGANYNGTVFELAPLVANHVAVDQQPGNITAGSTDSVTVQLEDTLNNVDTTADSNITVSIASGPNGASVTGTTTVAAVDGVATFSNLNFTQAGNYTLTFSDGNLTAATSNSFIVSAGAATQLAFAQQPTGAVAGSTLSPVIVNVEDAYGNVVSTDGSNVTLTATPGDGAASTPAQDGVATFGALSFTQAGTYSYTATDGSLTPATSNSFTIAPGSASQLVVTQEPEANTTGHAVSATIVAVEDAYGNVVTSDDSNVTVTLSGSGTGVLGGTASLAALNGVVTFNDLTISESGTYLLTFADGGLTPAQSDQVTVPQGPDVTAGAKLDAVSVDLGTTNQTFGKHETLTATLVSGPAGAKLWGKTKVIATNGQASFNTLKFKQAGTYTIAISDADGTVMQQTVTVAAATPTHLQFAQQPTIMNGEISAAVEYVDRFGNVVTTASSPITLHAGPYETLRGGVLEGAVTQSPIDGIATFSNLTVTSPGLYRLIARAADAALVGSNIFKVS